MATTVLHGQWRWLYVYTICVLAFCWRLGVLFLDAGQQIIRAALLPSVHRKLLHEAWRVSINQSCRDRGIKADRRGERETHTHRAREACEMTGLS